MPAPWSDGGRLLLDLTSPATPAHLDRIHDRLLRFLCDAGVATTDRIRFETAVVELVGNVVKHARPRREGSSVDLRMTVTRDTRGDGGSDLRAVLVDDAEPVEVDLEPARADDDACSGRGLALIRAFCDDLTHEVSPAGNRWSVLTRCGS